MTVRPFTFTVRPSKFEQPQPAISAVTLKHAAPIVPSSPLVPPVTSFAGLHGALLGLPTVLVPPAPVPALAVAPPDVPVPLVPAAGLAPPLLLVGPEPPCAAGDPPQI